jgi:hypothetical protein
MPVVELAGVASVFRTPKAQFRARLAEFSEHEINNFTIKDFEAIAFDLRNGPMGGAGLFDTWEQKMLDHILNDPANTPAATNYLALSSTTPTEAAGNITEPSGGSYARVATTNADWSAASGTAPAVKTNTATLTFPAATADWVAAANLTYFILYDHITATGSGHEVAFGALTTAKPVLNGDTASFAASAVTFQMGDPGDSY